MTRWFARLATVNGVWLMISGSCLDYHLFGWPGAVWTLIGAVNVVVWIGFCANPDRAQDEPPADPDDRHGEGSGA